ncbi:hypothetical protein QN277_028333 [Acacia crassicarpa]|uniref:Late embryogenesis abundant protein LEA-2 subgroup domain-containing protein n=1 Tax=Acacia crassicarpa TaxID=499986 RepID=A0AAE1J6B1_9FABA|nr:hypothetical protein QN277_028333 [Acacia crassicarpa]
MSEEEQVKPLTPPSFTNSSSSYEHRPLFINDHHKSCGRRLNNVQCCGCVTAILLVIVVTFLIFGFTVYNVKEPQLILNGVTLINSTQSSDSKNLTLIADISVKNPNVFTFRFGSSTTTLTITAPESEKG